LEEEKENCVDAVRSPGTWPITAGIGKREKRGQ